MGFTRFMASRLGRGVRIVAGTALIAVGIVERHADAVFNVAYRVTWNAADAQDVVQESFVRAFLHYEDLRDQTRARPWLLSIAYRQSLMLLRARRESPTEPALFESRADHGADPVDAIVHQEQAVLVRHAIDRLSDELRTARSFAMLKDFN